MVPVALMLLLMLPPQTPDFHDEGIKALEAKQYPAAIAAFEKAVAAEPNDYAAHFHLGLARSMAGQAAEAAAAYRKTLELKPGLYEAELNLGVALAELKQYDEAIRNLKSAREKKPQEVRPNLYLADALLRSGEAAEAERQYRAVLAIDGKSAEAWPGLLEIASAHEKAKQLPAAVTIYRDFLASGAAGDTAAVSERLGELLLESGQAAEAIALLEASVKQSPTAANRFALATAYLRDKQKDKAAAMMEQATAADPKNPELAIAYAGMLRDERDFANAAKHFWRATQLKADSREAWAGLATMLLSLENYPQALAAFDRLESLGEPNEGIYFLKALAYDKTKQYKPAQAAYQKFLAMSSNRHPDEEFKARQRLKVIEKELSRR